MENKIAIGIEKVAVETFEVMCYLFPLAESEITAEKKRIPAEVVTSAVRFDGAVRGGMILRTTPELLQAIAVNMLGVEEVSEEQKKGALCEIVNIMCGNVTPLFTSGGEICYIHPPWVAEQGNRPEDLFQGMNQESLVLYMDEGPVEILVYYTLLEEMS